MMSERSEINFVHRSVLLDECIEGLDIKPDGIYVDGTTGGGGHSYEIAARLTQGGRLICLDQDADAIAAASERLKPFADRVTFVRCNFCEVRNACESLGIDHIDGMLLDLGVSSYQLDTAERGFSYQKDAPLDMRMDNRNAKSAYEVVNEYSEQELKRIIYEYGEERYAPKIAAAIGRARAEQPIRTTGELVALIKGAMPAAAKEGGHHPAKRTFQAIRIEVNAELDVIKPAVEAAVDMLAPGGRVAVITFHSLEDRMVKQTYASLAQGCTCPRGLPVCVCGNVPRIRVETRKPILPCDKELEENPRSRSAKLRIATKL